MLTLADGSRAVLRDVRVTGTGPDAVTASGGSAWTLRSAVLTGAGLRVDNAELEVTDTEIREAAGDGLLVRDGVRSPRPGCGCGGPAATVSG